MVSEKGANTIDTYPVDRWGRAGPGTAHASAGAAPFGFAFGRHDDALLRDRGRRQRAQFLPARSVRDDHGVAPARSGRGLLGSIDADWAPRLHRQCGDRLHLRLLGGLGRQPRARHPGRSDCPTAAGTHPLDEAISRDRTLYVNGGNTGDHHAFRINGNGSLTSLGSVSGLPAPFGGLAVS